MARSASFFAGRQQGKLVGTVGTRVHRSALPRFCWEQPVKRYALPPLALLLALGGGSLLAADRPALSFKKTQLDTAFRSEGVAVGDFNSDGKLDISAGSVYYAAPDWKMVVIGEKANEYDPKSYSTSFQNFAEDLNGDGRADLIVVEFPGRQTWWFEQPAKASEPWKKHEITAVTNNESPAYLDVDGDGRRELVCSVGEKFALLRPSKDPYAPWDIQTISEANSAWGGKFYHGLGAGDINGDGRNDIVIPNGWWEAPADNKATTWKFHPADLGPKCANMHVYDFDGDGDQDVISSSAHDFGIWWHEQTPDGFVRHDIDRGFSQTHALEVADINGDGKPDFVTGKRWWAHAQGDPGGDDPAVLHWFEFQPRDGKPQWISHQIDHNSGVGTQFEIADINGDGLLDIAIANKKGVFVFEQQRE